MNQKTVQSTEIARQIRMKVCGATVKLNIAPDNGGTRMETVKRMILGGIAKV